MTDRDPRHDELEALDDQNDPVAEYEKLMRRQRRPADDALAEFDAMVDRQRGGQRDYGAELDALGDDVGTSSTARQLERTAILMLWRSSSGICRNARRNGQSSRARVSPSTAYPVRFASS